MLLISPLQMLRTIKHLWTSASGLSPVLVGALLSTSFNNNEQSRAPVSPLFAAAFAAYRHDDPSYCGCYGGKCSHGISRHTGALAVRRANRWEPGIGYLLRPGFELPPLMFTPEELLALMVGMRMVRAFTDPDLAQSARQSEEKIRSILTDQLKLSAERQPYRIPILDSDNELREVHRTLRLACDGHNKVRTVYCDEQQRKTERILWPLGIIGWTGRWTLLAWCEKRKDYRNFRFDRFVEIECMDERFSLANNVCIAHYFQTVLGIPDID